ncbi:hypothetical protein [Streptomyces sp. NPDC058953]|uniref:hypothetical protein n=1 Tax=unclassified Streptomyces TaxID=2593676 RepID=UPI0036868FE6
MRTGYERRRHIRFLFLSCFSALVLVTAAVVFVVAGPPGDRLWRGIPYPTADPDTAADRVRDESRRIHTDLGARPDRAPVFNTLRSSRCLVRAEIRVEKTDRSAVGVRHVWELDGVDRAAARTAIDQAGRRLRDDRWKEEYAYDEKTNSRGGMGARYKHPDTGYRVAIQWVPYRNGLLVDVESPCRTIPDGHPKATGGPLEWRPDSPLRP